MLLITSLTDFLHPRCNKGLTEEDKNAVEKVKGHVQDMQNNLNEMEAFLPRKNGYWKITYSCIYLVDFGFVKQFVIFVSFQGFILALSLEM